MPAPTMTTVTYHQERPDGRAWRAPIVFRLVPGSYEVAGIFPGTVVYGLVDANGDGSIELWANEGGVESSYYECVLPSGEKFRFTVPTTGGPYTLSELREAGITASDPTYPTLLSLLGEANVKLFGAAGDGSDATDAVLECYARFGNVFFPVGQYLISERIDFGYGSMVWGAGMHRSKLISGITDGTDMLRFRDLTTSLQKEIGYAGARDLWLKGQATSGAGVKLENPYGFYAERLRVESFGGRGIDVEKGGDGSTYGQSVYIDSCWIRSNLLGGVRMYKAGGTSSIDLGRISRSSINSNGKYGIYLQQTVVVEIDQCELSGYSYGEVIAAEQAFPIVINGGNNVRIGGGMSFEGNGGNGNVSTGYNVRTGYDGDARAVAANDTLVLTVDGADFKPPETGKITHIDVQHVRGLHIDNTLFEGDPTYAVIAVDIVVGSASAGGFSMGPNIRWNGSNLTKLGALARHVLMMDFPYGVTTGRKAYGVVTDDTTAPWQWLRFSGENFDRFQLLGDGSALYGPGNTAPIAICKVPVVATGALPAAAVNREGIIIEDAGAGDRNIIVYAGNQRFRIDGGAAF